MKFEEIIKKVKEIKAPEIITDQEIKNSNTNNMKTLITQLKKVDLKTRRSIRALQILYIAMIGVMISYLFIAESSRIIIGIGFIILAFILVIFVQELRHRVYNYTYADNPVIRYLKDAKKRMRVFTVRTWYVIPIWICIDIGISLILSFVLQNTSYVLPSIILLQVLLIIIIVIDFYVAYLFWKRDHEPAIVEIDKMLEDIENPDKTGEMSDPE
jgi:membrane protein YdbS with pleckstrin-like domain